jgi:hypothetical protein
MESPFLTLNVSKEQKKKPFLFFTDRMKHVLSTNNTFTYSSNSSKLHILSDDRSLLTLLNPIIHFECTHPPKLPVLSFPNPENLNIVRTKTNVDYHQ